MFNVNIMQNKLDIVQLKLLKQTVLQNQTDTTIIPPNGLLSKEENTEKIKKSIESAKYEIKEYLTKIMNNNEKREQDLEQLQDIINASIQTLQDKRSQLKTWEGEKNVRKIAIGNLEQPIKEMHEYINKVEKELEKVHKAYARANEKGWKLIFYPALAFEVLGYEINSTFDYLRQRENQYVHELEKIWAEQKNEIKQLDRFANWIDETNKEIAEIKTIIEKQKIQIGEFKEEIVRWITAYLYYSIININLDTLEQKILNNLIINADDNTIKLEEQQVIELLEIWEEQKKDDKFIAKKIKDLGNYQQSEAYGIETDINFDDSDYFYKFLIKPQGIHIQSGYIIDGLEILYDLKMIELMHGGLGGGEAIIKLEEDEIIKIEGRYNVQFVIPSGDAISQIIITTKNRKTYGPFGDGLNRGIPFEINIPKGKQFIGFYGSESTKGNGGFISKIGAVYR